MKMTKEEPTVTNPHLYGGGGGDDDGDAHPQILQ
jgi:hypothetical protein